MKWEGVLWVETWFEVMDFFVIFAFLAFLCLFCLDRCSPITLMMDNSELC